MHATRCWKVDWPLTASGIISLLLCVSPLSVIFHQSDPQFCSSLATSFPSVLILSITINKQYSYNTCRIKTNLSKKSGKIKHNSRQVHDTPNAILDFACARSSDHVAKRISPFEVYRLSLSPLLHFPFYYVLTICRCSVSRYTLLQEYTEAFQLCTRTKSTRIFEKWFSARYTFTCI